MIFSLIAHNMVMDIKPDFDENLWGLPQLASRLDMAVEANALLRGQANQEIEGVV